MFAHLSGSGSGSLAGCTLIRRSVVGSLAAKVSSGKTLNPILPPVAVQAVCVYDGSDMYLYGGTGRVLQFHQSVAFILDFVHLALVGQQIVVLEVLIEIKSKCRYFLQRISSSQYRTALLHILCIGSVRLLSRSWPRTAGGHQVGPPCGRSSPASWSYPALLPGKPAPCCSPACIHTGCSGSGDATWSCPRKRKKKYIGWNLKIFKVKMKRWIREHLAFCNSLMLYKV